MFKKRDKKATLRRAQDDDEGESNQPENSSVAESAASLESSKSVGKTKKSKPAATSLLSFGDEEGEDEEVFTVKRSAHSRKVVQQFKARNHRKNKAPAVNTQVSAPGSYSADALAELRSSSTKQAETKGATTKQETTEEARSHDVLADVSSAMISDGGAIPSAELIHLARKKRQMARSSGKEDGADFIPLDDTVRAKLSTGRLVREDDNDRSDGEDGLENRSFSDISQKATNKERQRELKQAVATDGVVGEEDDDDDAIKRWEEQQMRSAASAMVAFDHSLSAQETTYSSSGTRNYFFGPALPSGYPAADASSSLMFPQGMPMNGQAAVPTQVVSLPEKLSSTSLQSFFTSLQSSLDSLKESATSHAGQQSRLEEELQLCQKSAASLEDEIAGASERYTFFQEMRGYTRDLLSCVGEKLPLIEQLGSRMLSLYQGRAKRLLERRKQDLLDECDENVERGKVPSSFDAAFQHRAAEREGRRARRRHQRQLNGQTAPHNGGMSSDDEELESDRVLFNTERAKIVDEAGCIFEDTNEEFSSLQLVCNRFEMWKFGYCLPYENAYIPLCLSKLCAPFVHLDTLTWNPLEDGQKLLEEYTWFQQLLFYGSGSLSKMPQEDDDDVKLIPTLVEKVILPKLRGFLESVFDPLSTQQTQNAVALVRQLVNDCPTLHSQSRHTQELFQCLVERLKHAVDNDAYIPLYSKSALENISSKACQFFHRQFWTCFKLFSNLLAWHELISPTKLQSLALEGLLSRYLLVALQHMPQHYSVVDKCQKIVGVLPQQWFENVKAAKSLQGTDSLAHLMASHLPAHIYRSALGAPDVERQKSREAIRQLVKLLAQIGHAEKSKALLMEYNLTT